MKIYIPTYYPMFKVGSVASVVLMYREVEFFSFLFYFGTLLCIGIKLYIFMYLSTTYFIHIYIYVSIFVCVHTYIYMYIIYIHMCTC